MEVCSQIHTPATFLLRKEPQYPKNRRLGWSQTWCTCFGEEETLWPLLGTESWLLQQHMRCNHGHVITWGCSATTWSDIHSGITHLHTLEYHEPICNTVWADRCHIIREYLYWMGHVVVQLVKALRYKPEDPEFDSWWCHWNFSWT